MSADLLPPRQRSAIKALILSIGLSATSPVQAVAGGYPAVDKDLGAAIYATVSLTTHTLFMLTATKDLLIRITGALDQTQVSFKAETSWLAAQLALQEQTLSEAAGIHQVTSNIVALDQQRLQKTKEIVAAVTVARVAAPVQDTLQPDVSLDSSATTLSAQDFPMLSVGVGDSAELSEALGYMDLAARKGIEATQISVQRVTEIESEVRVLFGRIQTTKDLKESVDLNNQIKIRLALMLAQRMKMRAVIGHMDSAAALWQVRDSLRAREVR
jgi:hypothetical protein